LLAVNRELKVDAIFEQRLVATFSHGNLEGFGARVIQFFMFIENFHEFIRQSSGKFGCIQVKVHFFYRLFLI
jgi:hypothetical protein